MWRPEVGQGKKMQPRKGAITVLMALCTILMLAFTAFCIDIGWASLAQSGLQNAADSAATAAAAALNQGYATYSIPTQSSPSSIISSAQSTATSWATSYGSYNGSADLQSLNIASADVVFSKSDSSGVLSSSFTGFPNTVSVTVRRNGSINTALPLFFAPAIGTKSLSMTASASATIYTGVITSFSSTGGGEGSAGGYGGWGTSYKSSGSSSSFNNLLLPIGLDAVAWANFVNTGASPSNSTYASVSSSTSSNPFTSGSLAWYVWNALNGDSSGDDGKSSGDDGKSSGSSTSWDTSWSASSACNSNWWDFEWKKSSTPLTPSSSSTKCNNAPQCCIFPCPSQCPGMTGCISLDGNTVTDTAFSNWVINGASSSDIDGMCSKSCFPCTTSSPKSCSGSSTVSSTVCNSFASIVGQKRIMPVFKAVSTSGSYQACSGSGTSAKYQICGYVGVQVTSVTGSGSSTCINVQPCCVVDPTAVFDKSTLVPCGSEPTTQLKTYTCTAPKVCQ